MSLSVNQFCEQTVQNKELEVRKGESEKGEGKGEGEEPRRASGQSQRNVWLFMFSLKMLLWMAHYSYDLIRAAGCGGSYTFSNSDQFQNKKSRGCENKIICFAWEKKFCMSSQNVAGWRYSPVILKWMDKSFLPHLKMLLTDGIKNSVCLWVFTANQ